MVGRKQIVDRQDRRMRYGKGPQGEREEKERKVRFTRRDTDKMAHEDKHTESAVHNLYQTATPINHTPHS